MDQKLQNSLMNQFPELLLRDRGSMQFGIECMNGWFDLIHDLCTHLDVELKRCQKLPDYDPELAPRITTIKEKFGELRVYMSFESQRMSELIEKASSDSRLTCEICGKPGTIDFSSKWYECRCGRHCRRKS